MAGKPSSACNRGRRVPRQSHGWENLVSANDGPDQVHPPSVMATLRILDVIQIAVIEGVGWLHTLLTSQQEAEILGIEQQFVVRAKPCHSAA